MAAIGTCTAMIGTRVCGEFVGEKTRFCRSCGTPEKREANNKAQAEIEKENNAKGYGQKEAKN